MSKVGTALVESSGRAASPDRESPESRHGHYYLRKACLQYSCTRRHWSRIRRRELWEYIRVHVVRLGHPTMPWLVCDLIAIIILRLRFNVRIREQSYQPWLSNGKGNAQISDLWFDAYFDQTINTQTTENIHVRKIGHVCMLVAGHQCPPQVEVVVDVCLSVGSLFHPAYIMQNYSLLRESISKQKISTYPLMNGYTDASIVTVGLRGPDNAHCRPRPRTRGALQD